MAFDIDPCTFDFLSLAKDLYDYGLLDQVLENCGSWEVCEDCYSLAWEGTANVFADFRQYYEDENGVETLVFSDPVITGFYRLCAFYEAKNGISKDRNPFRQGGERAAYQCFYMDAYDFDVRLYDGARGCPRLVILSGEEFYGHQELPGALAETKDTLDRCCKKLKAAIITEKPLTAVPEYTGKEAA